MVIQIGTELDENALIVHADEPVRGPETRREETVHEFQKQHDHSSDVVAELPSGGDRVKDEPCRCAQQSHR